MKKDLRHKNASWTIEPNENGNYSYAGASLAVLQDIRDELREIKYNLGHGLREMKYDLKILVKNTRKRKPGRKKK